MPANLTPEYLEAEREYRKAKTPEEKLRCLEYMLSVIPKHKGTDKLQADLKRRISKLKEGGKKSAASRRSSMFNVPGMGAGQVALAGAPNCGKSAILDVLTNAAPEVADYPYTTMKPQPGMMPFENIQVQIVDLPPIGRDYTETWIPGVIRNADLALMVVNLASDDVLDETEYVIDRLAEGKVELVDTIEQRFKPDGSAQVKTRMVLTHAEWPGAEEIKELVQEVFGHRFRSWDFSAVRKEDVEALPGRIFEALEIVRVYTKSPGKEPDWNDPVVLPLGSTVMDFAIEIHKDLARNLKYARIWGKDKYDGQKVTKEYQLIDQDVIELHS